MLDEKNLKDISKILKQEDEIEFAYLYGSHAKNIETMKSDVDIGIFVKKINNFNYKTLAKISSKIEKKIGLEIDLRILNNRNITFLHQVIKDGKLIFVRNDPERIRFETKVYDKYLDFKPYIEHYNKIRRKRLLS